MSNVYSLSPEYQDIVYPERNVSFLRVIARPILAEAILMVKEFVKDCFATRPCEQPCSQGRVARNDTFQIYMARPVMSVISELTSPFDVSNRYEADNALT